MINESKTNTEQVAGNGRQIIKCPRCGCVDIAEILYGHPAFDNELAALLYAGNWSR